jgi:ADP-dependent phosphofructokinase/glucokinase
MVYLSLLKEVLKKVLAQMLSLQMNRVELNYRRDLRILGLCRKILLKKQLWMLKYRRMKICITKQKLLRLWVKGKEYFLNLR